MDEPCPFRTFLYEGNCYVVVNPSASESLPGVPIWDPELNIDVRDMRKALWAVNSAPEMAYMLKSKHSSSPFLARLFFDAQHPPIVQTEWGWMLDDQYRDSWSDLEKVLLYINDVLSPLVSALPEADFPFDSQWPLPSENGLLRAHKTSGCARRALWRSRDALVLLAARCSMMIALTNMLPPASPPRWERALHAVGLSQVWVDEFASSIIADLSPGKRVGAFINPSEEEAATQWVKHVPCMIKANLPVYIHWPHTRDGDGDGNGHHKILERFPFLTPYRPRLGEALAVTVPNPELWMPFFRWSDYEPRKARSKVASFLSTIPHGQGQRPGESFPDLLQRRALQNATWAAKEEARAKASRQARELEASRFGRPNKRTPVFMWVLVGDVDEGVDVEHLECPYRKLIGHHAVGELWLRVPNSDKYFDAWRNEWDICTVVDLDEDPLDNDPDLESIFYPDVAETKSYSTPQEASGAFPSTSHHDTVQDASILADLGEAIRRDLAMFYDGADFQGYIPLIEPVDTIVRGRYGILGVHPSSAELEDPSSVYNRFSEATILKYFGLTEEDRSVFHLHCLSVFIDDFKRQQLSGKMTIWDLSPSCDQFLGLPEFKTPGLVIVHWPLTPSSLYSITYSDDPDNLYDVLVEAPTAVELLRNQCSSNISSRATLIEFLVSKGIPFRTVYDPHPAAATLETPQDPWEKLNHRTKSFRATPWDYAAYQRHALDFLRTPRGRAAFLRGGIIWRLACEIASVYSPSVVDRALEGPSSEALRFGEAFMLPRGTPYYDDALTEAEEDLLCGTYTVYDEEYNMTSKISWWPRTVHWRASGLKFGYWTPFCEHWFQQRLLGIREGKKQPETGKHWKRSILFYKDAMKLHNEINLKCQGFLRDALRIPVA